MTAWYYCEAGRVMGPLSEREVIAAVEEHLLAPETPVWCEGMNAWAALGVTTEFFQHFSHEERRHARGMMPDSLPDPPKPLRTPPAQPTPPPPHFIALPVHQYAAPVLPYSPRNKIVAGLLGIFLGCFGIHRFYLGYNGVGVLMLLLTVLTCGYGAAITGLWSLIEGILCLTGTMRDAQGRPLE